MTMTTDGTSCSKMAELETIHKGSYPPAGVRSEGHPQLGSSKGCSYSNGAPRVSACNYVSLRVQELLQKPQRRYCFPQPAAAENVGQFEQSIRQACFLRA